MQEVLVRDSLELNERGESYHDSDYSTFLQPLALV